MKPKIAIIDYGMANLRSVQKAFENCGAGADITSDPNRIAEADKIVLPGVGAFQDAIARLRESDLARAIVDFIQTGRPFLGICLGLQMLFTRSHEDGEFEGLNLFRGDVVRFRSIPGLKVPHMGWNTLTIRKPGCPLFRDLPDNPSVYFVHSYYPLSQDDDLIAATADYPTAFPCAIWRDNVMATQFHPEKSQAVGLKMLRNFAEM
jgi:glutamine amidotransferase